MRYLIATFLLIVSLGATGGDSFAESGGRHPVALPSGAWLLAVEFPAVPGAPPPPPPFSELLTLHALGTVSETNTLLNENSYNPALGQGCGFTGPGGALELNCNGSSGAGSWRRTGRNTVSFVFVKYVYDGASNAHVGFLRVRSERAVINGDRLVQDSRFTATEILIGTDLDTAIPIPLGGANSAGHRID